MKPKNPTNYTPWGDSVFASWCPTTVRSALNDLECGRFQEPAKLVDQLKRADRIAATFETRQKGLFGKPRKLGPADPDSDLSQVAEMVRDKFDHFVPHGVMVDLFFWYLYLGFAIAQVVWEVKGRAWVPRLRVWNPQSVVLSEDGQHYEISTREGLVTIPISGDPDGKWITFGRGDRPWMNGLVRCLAIPFLILGFSWRDHSRYNERHGMPIVMARTPAHASGPSVEEFLDGLRNLSTETTVELPHNLGEDSPLRWDLELLEAKANTSETFDRLQKKADLAITIATLGNNLTTHVEGGSLAAAQVQDGVRLDYIRGDDREMAAPMNTQAFPAILSVLGSTDLFELYLFWDIEPPADDLAVAESIEALGRAISSIEATGRRVLNIDVLAARYGVEVSDLPEAAKADPGDAERLSALAIDDGGSVSEGDAVAHDFITGLSADTTKKVARQIKRSAASLMEIIDGADSLDEVEAALVDIYANMPEHDVASELERALVLAELAGRWAVESDL